MSIIFRHVDVEGPKVVLFQTKFLNLVQCGNVGFEHNFGPIYSVHSDIFLIVPNVGVEDLLVSPVKDRILGCLRAPTPK